MLPRISILALVAVLGACSGGSTAVDAGPLRDDSGLVRVTVRCDVAAQDCPAGQRCDFTCEDGVLVIACTPEVASPAKLGESCSGGRDAGTLTGSNCTRGTGCFTTVQKPASCYQYCKTGSECPAGTTCMTNRTYRVVCPKGGGDLPVGICL